MLKHWPWIKFLVLGTLIGCFFAFRPVHTNAQNQSDLPSYWQYSASGQVKHVIEEDIDRDGIDDFIIADENGRVDMIDSTGASQWRYLVRESVTTIASANLMGNANSPLEIVIGDPNRLTLLSSTGEEIWRVAITPLQTSPSLLPSGPPELAGEGLDEPHYIPIKIVPFDENSDGQPEILVLLQTGELLSYNNQGEIIWQEISYESTPPGTIPKLLVFDFDGDGKDEILFSVFNPRRFGQLILVDEGQIIWEIPVSGRITDMVQIGGGENQPPLIAIGTSLGHLQIFDHLRQQRWFRTLNQPITSLATFSIDGRNAIAAGTQVGTVVVYDQEGRRLWDNNLAPDADRKILAISTTEENVPPDQPNLAVTIESGSSAMNSAETILMGSNGQIISKINNVDSLGLTKFVDSNHDHNNELLVGHFATLELLGLGVGNSENVREWEYTLDAVPSALLISDLDSDGNDDIIIGTANGRIHSLNNDRSLHWLHDVGGAITHLAALPRPSSNENEIVVVRQGDGSGNNVESTWIEVRESKGERIWELELNSRVTALLVENIDQTNEVEIIVGMDDGRLIIFSEDGEKKSELHLQDLNGPVNQLAYLHDGNQPSSEIIASGDHILLGINLQNSIQPVRTIAKFENKIIDIYAIAEGMHQELSTNLIVTTNDQTVHGLNWRGIEMAQWPWPQSINGVPITSIASQNLGLIQADHYSFLFGTDTGHLIQLDIQDSQPSIPWQLDGIGKITALHWRDQDGDGSPDLSFAGTDDGKVWISSRSSTLSSNSMTTPLELSSSVFALDSIYRNDNQIPDLITITDNGIVQLFREQENRPPFITKPVAQVDQDKYTISAEINDVELDDVTVQLEIQDPESGIWTPFDTQTIANGHGSLFWTPPSTLTGPDGLRYQFIFSDGSNQGTLMPPPGPVSNAGGIFDNALSAVVISIGLIGLIFTVVFVRQSQSPTTQAGRFYRRLRKRPSQSLLLLEEKYAHSPESPDFLLHLANQARQANDEVIANLAHGLFLLEDRPQSGLSILITTLAGIEANGVEDWTGLERWLLTYQTCFAMLDSPSIMELSLLRPQFLQLLKMESVRDNPNNTLNQLKPILTNIRDSERVDLVEDRLVYLNGAAAQIRQVKEDLPNYHRSIEHSIVKSLVKRWSGLINAEIEDIRGRAQLTVSLKTKRLIPTKHTVVAIEVGNTGRSVAENIVIILDSDPAYIVYGEPEEIPFLPSGRTREVRFEIGPQVIDRFRIGFTITFDDRNRKNKVFAFGDMVDLLPPTREFRTIPNPYTPGTPLRPDSMLFFGREDLFDFIAENAGLRSYRNVLILVGQRRTGKTSALLRLEDHLPSDLLPVYIDCQSLGVIAGMPALLEEFAWTIADAVSKRGIDVVVPDLDRWQKDPTRLFQRQFLPEVISLLPPETTLLLVFDEFEAFENLVADGILPPTFFSYLRHLMQHGEQLNFIFVGTRRLEEMSSDYWSVLFNIALYRKIDYLTNEAAVRLITEPVADYLVYDDLAIDKILRVTAGHPYFLQLVCYTSVKHANSIRTSYITISDVNEAVDEMLSLGEVHFAYLWQRSTPTERALLTAVAHLMDQNAPFYPEELIDYLEPYYPQPDPVEVTRAFNQLVERDVLREVTEETKTIYELKLGLVGSWVAKNKSLSKLLASNGSQRTEITLDEPAM